MQPGSESIQSHILRRPRSNPCVTFCYSRWVTSSVSRRQLYYEVESNRAPPPFSYVYISLSEYPQVEIVALCMESSLAVFPPGPSMYLCFRLESKHYH